MPGIYIATGLALGTRGTRAVIHAPYIPSRTNSNVKSTVCPFQTLSPKECSPSTGKRGPVPGNKNSEFPPQRAQHRPLLHLPGVLGFLLFTLQRGLHFASRRHGILGRSQRQNSRGRILQETPDKCHMEWGGGGVLRPCTCLPPSSPMGARTPYLRQWGLGCWPVGAGPSCCSQPSGTGCWHYSLF